MRAAFSGLAFALVLVIGCGDDKASEPPVSFKKEVMPFLAESCALTACHASAEKNLNIHLTADPVQVYAELQRTSSFGPKYIVAGKPSDSFVMRKMDGTQKTMTGCSKGCGVQMPPDDPIDRDSRDLIRQWIIEGAKNN